jgi:hypothetical protein
MNKLSLVISYFIITPAVVFLTLVFCLFIAFQNTPHATIFPVTPQSTAYAALPATDGSNTIDTSITTSDAREAIISQYLEKFNSPLMPYANDLIAAADMYNLDYRLIPAIAMQESNLCRVIPNDSYNCYGYGIYVGHTTRFANYQEGIWKVAQTLGTKYKEDGLNTPAEIMQRWTPHSPNGAWAINVQSFMDNLK